MKIFSHSAKIKRNGEVLVTPRRPFHNHPSKKGMAMAQPTVQGNSLPVKRPNFKGANNPRWKGGPSHHKCEQCGEHFAVKRGSAAKGRFCSLVCANHAQSRKPYLRGSVAKVTQTCLMCPVTFQVYRGHIGRKRFCSERCHGKWRSQITSGAGNPNWNGGTSKIPYPFEWPEMSKRIMERDGHECHNPLCRKNSSLLHVHHIDYDKFNLDEMNLITVCNSCNARANFRRQWWTRHYKSVMAKRFS